LFFNSLEFIENNKPRFFIFENVKGLLSDDGGKTFSEWVNFLGGKSVNGAPVLFPYADSVPYHLYWKVLNAKHHGVPQNRERVFLIGIRDEKDNNFSFPAEEHLTNRLKDVLESEVDEKYFLSENIIKNLQIYNDRQIENNRGFSAKFRDVEETETMDALKVGGGGTYDLIKIKSATSKGYEIATEGDSINFSVPNSETRRGRVGKGVAQTLDTACNQAVIQIKESKNKFRFHKNDKRKSGIQGMDIIKNDGICDTITNTHPGNTITDKHIRRLTPRECFRLMDFPDSFTWLVSDSQAYKQAGNSIVVNVLYKILKNLNI